MAKDIAIIQVCFNVLDPHQKMLYERAASFPNRSAYLKRLIQWDADKEQGAVVQTVHRTAGAAVDDFQAEGFI